MRISSRFFAASLFGCCLLAATSHAALAQAAAKPATPAVGTPISPAQVYDKLLSGMEKEFVDAAEAMPEDKYDFAPPTTAGEFKGVRTFGGQVKHVAEAGYYFFGGPNFSEAEDKAKSEAIEKLTTKSPQSRRRMLSSRRRTEPARVWQPLALLILWIITVRCAFTYA